MSVNAGRDQLEGILGHPLIGKYLEEEGLGWSPGDPPSLEQVLDVLRRFGRVALTLEHQQHTGDLACVCDVHADLSGEMRARDDSALHSALYCLIEILSECERLTRRAAHELP